MIAKFRSKFLKKTAAVYFSDKIQTGKVKAEMPHKGRQTLGVQLTLIQPWGGGGQIMPTTLMLAHPDFEFENLTASL